jgi:predicted secreted protein
MSLECGAEMRRAGALVLLGAALLAPTLFSQSAATGTSTPRVSRTAIWNPTPQRLADIRSNCGAGDSAKLADCFYAAMQSAGASPDAVAFAKTLPDEDYGFLRGFRATGRVAIAYVQYVFRANEMEGVFLVNGDPPAIDVDNQKNFSLADLAKNPVYAALAAKYPQISMWPDDRFHMTEPTLNHIAGGGLEFIVSYILRDQCHACPQVGKVHLAFEFDAGGKFLGAKVADVIATTQSSGASSAGGAPQEIRAAIGEQFSISLDATHSSGYRWRLRDSLANSPLSLVKSEYKEDAAGQVGAGGKETWTFKSSEAGPFTLHFDYVRPWEKNVPPAKTSSWKITIK